MWKTISSKIVHKNPWWRVSRDEFQMPSGKKGNYFMLETRGSSFIVAVKEGKILLERQYRYRYPLGNFVIEVPGGQLKEGSAARAAAREELEEELGYRAKQLKKIGAFVPFIGVSNEKCTVFLATELAFVGTKREETEVMNTLEIDIATVYEMIESGKINDGMSIAALAIARPYLMDQISP